MTPQRAYLILRKYFQRYFLVFPTRFLSNIIWTWKIDWYCFSVCACGKWVCTNNSCNYGGTLETQGQRERGILGENISDSYKIWAKGEHETDSVNKIDDGRNSEDEELGLEEEDPEDDPDVQDIRWF